MTERALADHRLEAERLVRDKEWESLHALGERLRDEDTEMWPSVWGPMCAVAAWHRRMPHAREVLESAIDQGFCQPDFFLEEFGDTFATEAGWAELLARMRTNVPLPAIQLNRWPTASPTELELDIDRLPVVREEILLSRLPDRDSSAWTTARGLHSWVAARWNHANDHVESRDAVEILDRVETGERFACVEYSAVLSQSLNAVGIPARTWGLRMLPTCARG